MSALSIGCVSGTLTIELVRAVAAKAFLLPLFLLP
jgi:precorrin-6B methylase 2